MGLNAFISIDGLLRVGGRLREAALPFEDKYPIILDSNHPITLRYLHFIHEESLHQGRVITLGQVRSNGVFVIKARRAIDNLIKNCFDCQRLRAPLSTQIMAHLPAERLDASPCFTHIGVDCFGPFYVTQGKGTRTTTATKKVFVLIINCLASRAIHLEPLESMETSSFINALRRFFSLRGTASLIEVLISSGLSVQSNSLKNSKDS